MVADLFDTGGEAVPDSAPLSPQEVHNLCYSVMNDEQRRLYEQTMELNMGLRIKDLGRFRINVFRQQEEPALVARHIRSEIPSIEALNLPPLLKEALFRVRLALNFGRRSTPLSAPPNSPLRRL